MTPNWGEWRVHQRYLDRLQKAADRNLMNLMNFSKGKCKALPGNKPTSQRGFAEKILVDTRMDMSQQRSLVAKGLVVSRGAG